MTIGEFREYIIVISGSGSRVVVFIIEGRRDRVDVKRVLSKPVVIIKWYVFFLSIVCVLKLWRLTVWRRGVGRASGRQSIYGVINYHM